MPLKSSFSDGSQQYVHGRYASKLPGTGWGWAWWRDDVGWYRTSVTPKPAQVQQGGQLRRWCVFCYNSDWSTQSLLPFCAWTDGPDHRHRWQCFIEPRSSYLDSAGRLDECNVSSWVAWMYSDTGGCLYTDIRMSAMRRSAVQCMQCMQCNAIHCYEGPTGLILIGVSGEGKTRIQSRVRQHHCTGYVHFYTLQQHGFIWYTVDHSSARAAWASGCALSHQNQKHVGLLMGVDVGRLAGGVGRRAGPTRSEGSGSPTQPSQPTRRQGRIENRGGVSPAWRQHRMMQQRPAWRSRVDGTAGGEWMRAWVRVWEDERKKETKIARCSDEWERADWMMDRGVRPGLSKTQLGCLRPPASLRVGTSCAVLWMQVGGQ